MNDLENQLFSALARHGGKRKGAGRPKKGNEKRQLTNFTFSPETIQLLRENVPSYRRSDFVETAILRALKALREP